MISDASPLIVLAKAGLLSLLPEGVRVPQAVWKECIAGGPLQGASALEAWRAQGRLHIVADPSGTVPGFDLGRGERAALLLAAAEGQPLLVDDRRARQAGRILGVATVGCLGVVLRARHQGSMRHEEAVTALSRLLEAGLWVTADVVNAVRTELDDRR